MRIGIVGGGVAGLACAHYLLKSGHTPVVFEVSAELGGLGAQFAHNGIMMDRVPHYLMDTDSALCGLMADLGALGQLTWKETRRGLVTDRRLYSWETAADLLQFDAVRFDERIRAGLMNLYLTRARRYGLNLDGVPAWDWLQRLFGPSFFERVWAPLLRAHFGDHTMQAPAYWAWKLLNRHMRGHREIRGYIRGGFSWLAEQLYASIEARGGEIRLCSRVTGLHSGDRAASIEVDGADQEFDGVISTLALPLLNEIAPRDLLRQIPVPAPAYQGIRSAVVVLRSQLERFYTTNVLDDHLPFHTVVETTHVVPTSCTGGYHLVYLLNHSGTETEDDQVADDVVKKEAVEGLTALYPDFDPLDVEDVHVLRTPFAYPIWTVGSMNHTPPIRIGHSRVFLCTSAQAYPRVPGWDSSVALSRETTAKIIRELA
jgi:protoporphyrinogen oxidase